MTPDQKRKYLKQIRWTFPAHVGLFVWNMVLFQVLLRVQPVYALLPLLCMAIFAVGAWVDYEQWKSLTGKR